MYIDNCLIISVCFVNNAIILLIVVVVVIVTQDLGVESLFYGPDGLHVDVV